MSSDPKEFKFTPRTWFSLILVVMLLGAIALTQFATQQSRDGRSQAAGFTNHTVTWPNNVKFRNRVCLFGTSQCQPWSPNLDGTSYSWTVASNVAYDYNVQVGHSGNWYTWKNNSFSQNCGSASTCTYTVTWTQAVYLVRTNLDNTDHPVTKNGTSYTYNNVPADTNFSGTVDYLDFQTVGNRHTMANIGGQTGSCTISCPPSPPTVDIKANGSNGPITITYNTAAQISWTSTSTGVSCTISPSGWTGASNTGRSTGNLTSNRTYTANCSNSAGNASDSVTVNVGAPPPPPPVNPPPVNPPPVNPPPVNPPPVGVNPPPPPVNPPPPVGGCLFFCSPPPPPPPPLVTAPVNPSGPRLTPPGQVAVPNSTADITLNFAANPYLKGGMEVIVTVENTGVSQKIILDSKGGTFILQPGTLSKAVGYKLKVSSKNSLIQTVPFTYADSLSLNIAELTTGDFNNDNTVNSIDLDKLSEAGFNSQDSLYDINYDAVVNSIDYALLLANQGKSGN